MSSVKNSKKVDNLSIYVDNSLELCKSFLLLLASNHARKVIHNGGG